MPAHTLATGAACLGCGEPLPLDANPRRLTCSNRCRTRVFRQRRDTEHAAALAELARLRALLGERV